MPFVQSGVSQDTQRARQAPNPQQPYFKVREALPIPAAYTPTEQGRLVGLLRRVTAIRLVQEVMVKVVVTTIFVRVLLWKLGRAMMLTTSALRFL